MKLITFFFQTLKVFILFTLCTVLFYYGIMWVNQEYDQYHYYDKPQGAAVKVSATTDEHPSMINRLLLFYLDGE